MNLSAEDLSKLWFIIIVVICFLLVNLFHFNNWKRSATHEHNARCTKSFEELRRKILHARLSECHFLEDQIDDFYAEYINLANFDRVRKCASELHAQLCNRRMALSSGMVMN